MPANIPSVRDALKSSGGGVGVEDLPPLAPIPPTAVDVAAVDGEEPEVAQARAILESPKVTGGDYRKNPERFFGPVIASLIATGSSPENCHERARLAFVTMMELCDEVSSGRLDGRVGVQLLGKEVARRRVERDREAQEKTREAAMLQGKLQTVEEDDARRPTYQRKLETLRAEARAAQQEVTRIEQKVMPALLAMNVRV